MYKKKLFFVLIALLFNIQFFYSQNCTANAGGSQIVCNSDATLIGTVSGPTSGGPTWSFVSGPSTPTIVSPNTLTTAVTGMTVSGDYVFKLSNPCGVGISEDFVTISAHPKPASFTAGPDITNSICATVGTTNLAGVIPAGFTGKWTVVPSENPNGTATNYTISDNTIANPTFSLINKANHEVDPGYKLTLTITSADGVCSYSDDMYVKFCPNPNINLNSSSFCLPSGGSTSSWIDLSSPPYFKTEPSDAAGSTLSGTTVTLNVISQPSGANMTFASLDTQRIYFNGATISGIYTFTLTVTNCCGTFTTAPTTLTINGKNPGNLNFQPTGHGVPEQLVLYASGGSGGEVHCDLAGTSTPELFYFDINSSDDPTQVITTFTSAGILPTGASTPTVTLYGAGTAHRYVSVDPGASGWKVGTYRFSGNVSNGTCGTSNDYYIHISDKSRPAISIPDVTTCTPGSGTVNTTITLPAVYKGVINPSYFQDLGGFYDFSVISQPVGSLPLQFPSFSDREITDASTIISNFSLPGDYVIRIRAISGNGAGPFLEQEYACSGVPQVYDDFTVSIKTQVNANAGSDQVFVCSSDVFLQGNDPGSGIGTWTIVSTPVGATTPLITHPNSMQSTVTGFDTIGNYVYRWTITNGGCTTFSEVNQSFTSIAPAAPTYTTNPPSCSNGLLGSIVITSPAPASNITYSIDNTSYQSNNVFSNISPGTYYVSYKINGQPCESYSGTVNFVGIDCSCSKPGATSGSTLDTTHGITALGRAGADDPDNWPMVRKGAWTALEAKTKGFVINRLSAIEIAAIPIANCVEGMMVYDTTNNCLKIYTTTDSGSTYSWQCFGKQTCPDNPGIPDPPVIPSPDITLAQNLYNFVVSIYDNNYLPYTDPIVAATSATINPDAILEDVLDYQGKITINGFSVKIPYTATGNGTLNAYSQTITVPSSLAEDGISRDLVFSWDAQPYTTGNGIITASIKAIGGTLNVKKLDINAGVGNDYLGLVLSTFTFPYNSVQATTNYRVRIMTGIPDKKFDIADFDGVKRHNFLYLPKKGPDNKYWLNNNLGADYNNFDSPNFKYQQQATAANDHHAYGSMFQWGRFSDGHEIVTWTGPFAGIVTATTTTRSNSPNNNVYILNSTANFNDWRINQDTTLWATEASANNPCPEGFMIPSLTQLNNATPGVTNAATAMANALKMPYNGYRYGSSGALSDVGTLVNYWSNTPNGYRSSTRWWSQSWGSGTFNQYRVDGFPVRCIQK